jgi:bifunctional UDP-N-acetylglucosamine pyrophosphorylase/glucosamine-1-phosphate N-acetyltransferase
MTYQIVVLAAGKGTRMGGNIPKVLVSLQSRPLVLYLAETLQKITQLTKPIAVVGYESEKVQAILGSEFTYAYQNKQEGTAQAVMSAKNFIKAENFLVLYGDMPFITSESIKKLMKLHRDNSANVSMLTTVVPNFEGMYKSFESFGRVVRQNGNIDRVVEFKDASNDEKNIKELNPGIYMFNTQWFWKHASKIQNKNNQNEYYLTDIVEIAILAGERVYSTQVDPKEVFGINSPEDLKFAEVYVNKVI